MYFDESASFDGFALSYREVIPDQTSAQIWKEITLNTEAAQSTLQDIKVAEKAGAFYYENVKSIFNRNRFIYWRTNRDILELSEISLDLNLINNNIRYKFTDSPVLSVSIGEVGESVVVLVATVSSVHHLKFAHPNQIHKSNDETETHSIFHEAGSRGAANSLFYVIGNASASTISIPHTAACTLSTDGSEAYFALAYQSNLMLFTMNCYNGQTTMVELKESCMVPRIFSNLSGALRGKSSTSDSQCATSLVFNFIDDTFFLYGLYRDDFVRMWSTRTGQLAAAFNCVQSNSEQRSHGSQNNLLRRASPDTLCAFLCNSIGSKFVTFQTIREGVNYSIHRINTIPAPEFDLIEFDVNESRIFGLWCNSQGEFNATGYSLLPNSEANWTSAAMELLPERKIEPETDPRQTYCSYIFYPGRFQREVIDRALVMFRRSNNLSDPNASLAVLKDRVCYAVEQEIQNELKDFEVTDDLYIETSFKHWERFYSCCEQYHLKSTQPIGLAMLENVGTVVVIKKSAFSLLRPCQLLEHLMLSGEAIDLDLNQLTLGDDITYRDFADLEKLVSVLALIEQMIPDEDKSEIDSKLQNLEMPNVIVSDLVESINSRDTEVQVCHEVNQEIRFIDKLPDAMISLLRMLRLHDDEQIDDNVTYSKINQTSRLFLSLGQLFRSNAGISIVAESVRQIAIVNFSLCRNLLILQQILMSSNDLPRDALEIVRSRCMPETVVFVQAYFVMVWICETSEVAPSPAALDASIQRLSILQLSDCRYKHRPKHPTTLLEQFLRGRGSQTATSMLAERTPEEFVDSHWKFTLLPLTKIVAQLIWSVSGNFVFGEWLIGSCQHILIQEYVRLLNSWCEWNKYSRHFIAAVSLLDNGEPHKAFDLFQQSAKGIIAEPFVEKIILHSSSSDELTQSEALAQYYLKVIQLFEQHSALDCVIRLALDAIGVLDATNPQLAMFQSIVFTSHLNLEHYTEAYHSLINNAESSRRKDCLRQLVVCLFEKQRLDLLMKFPYAGLQDELENIIESRARSMSIEGNNYYDFLHAFYVSKSNMRKAASIMYEQALRCSLECDTLTAIERRYDCLLVCVTALHLTDPKYAWIARPVVNEEDDDDQMETDSVELKRQVAVLEIGDIQKELVLTEAIIALAKHRRELNSILNADADELVAVLSNSGLYSMAVKLALEYKYDLSSILQSLAFACIHATDENSNETWTWLQENELADLPHHNSAREMTWKLLQSLIEEHEEDDSTKLHKAVAGKILNLGDFLPHWLFLSYRERNATELLRLYVLHGRLIEATELAVEYIQAMMSTGGEYFGLKNALHGTLPPLCFPVNTVDMLLYNLELNKTQDKEYDECWRELNSIVDKYIATAEQVSQNKIQFSM